MRYEVNNASPGCGSQMQGCFGGIRRRPMLTCQAFKLGICPPSKSESKIVYSHLFCGRKGVYPPSFFALHHWSDVKTINTPPSIFIIHAQFSTVCRFIMKTITRHTTVPTTLPHTRDFFYNWKSRLKSADISKRLFSQFITTLIVPLNRSTYRLQSFHFARPLLNTLINHNIILSGTVQSA